MRCSLITIYFDYFIFDRPVQLAEVISAHHLILSQAVIWKFSIEITYTSKSLPWACASIYRNGTSHLQRGLKLFGYSAELLLFY